jgi:hypothetical protein
MERYLESLRASTDLKLDFGFLRRSDDFIQNVFRQFANSENKIAKEDVLKAFEVMGIRIRGEDFESIFMEMDTNNDGRIDKDEFMVGVKIPTSVEVWAKSVAWWQPVADAIPIQQSGGDALRAVANLSNDEVDVICESLLLAIKRMLLEEVHRLKTSFEIMDLKSVESGGKAAIKFKTFKASCGKVLDFHEGLKGRVGYTSFVYCAENVGSHCVHRPATHKVL